jgi:hydroxymethylglutaryl-CoA reductase
MFIEPNIETILEKLSKLDSNSKPLWGTMSAQRMVEHLTEMVNVSNGKIELKLEIPEDRIEKMQQFLDSDKPMAKNIEVAFAPKDAPLKNEELELAIDELVEEWLNFEEYFEENPERTVLHAFYGQLSYDQWLKLHSKHFTHHFEQFGIN